MSHLKKTPLYDEYKTHGAKTIDFGGWDLPVQFSGIKEEHESVRTKAGLFDVSHMGELLVEGSGSLSYLQKMATNDVSKLKDGKAQYSALCYEDGGTVDDIIIYRRNENSYLLVVNAANIEKDFEWLQEHLGTDVRISNKSEEIAQLALQGPKAEENLQKITENTDLKELKFFSFKEDVSVAGVPALVSRTGYTGEDGFEIYCRSKDAVQIWKALLALEEVKPIGLGARDTLRFEAGLALYGQELSPSITPIEAGIGFAVKTDKEEDFFGKSVLKEQKENGAPRKLVGLEMIGRGIPRHGYKVFSGEQEIGAVTTGTQSPTLNKAVGYALIDAAYAEIGDVLTVEIRNKRIEAKITGTPFYKRPKNA
ncbi:glycine cleavage system aminomethyltransferase GcvT [Bacillus testis]|uniref:glycine cleavage system aminomethyltransferase GcvT n=1 Tax=Bacillus testis TaxID=1622072 RepID=UPI00067E7908|nr:glycine cleavage system aminomethyltransferase GcvT [Bacillus testis]